MKTNGLVVSALVALTLAIGARYSTAEELRLVDLNNGQLSEEDYNLCNDLNTDDYFHPFWFAGSELSYLKFDATTGGVITLSFDDAGTPDLDARIDPIRGMDDYTFTPRVWAGRQLCEKWSVVGRYWSLSQYDQRPPEYTHRLPHFAFVREEGMAEVYTVDLEAVRSFRSESPWEVDLSLGARYGTLFVHNNIFAGGAVFTDHFMNVTLENTFRFEGTGGVGGLSARRRIGRSNASLILGARGSVLRGETNSNARSLGSAFAAPASSSQSGASISRNDAQNTQANIIEVQAGLQFDYALKVIPANAFIRTTLEYQNWNIEGPPTGGSGFISTVGDLSVNGFTTVGIGDIEMVGVGFAAGISY